MEEDKNIVNGEGQPEQQDEAKVNKIVDDLTLFDDDLMSLVLTRIFLLHSLYLGLYLIAIL